MDIAEKAEEFINKQTDKVKQRVRNKAIKQAETQMIVAGKKLDELSLEDWEHVVAEQEKEVWDSSDRKSTRLNSSHAQLSRMPSSA